MEARTDDRLKEIAKDQMALDQEVLELDEDKAFLEKGRCTIPAP